MPKRLTVNPIETLIVKLQIAKGNNLSGILQKKKQNKTKHTKALVQAYFFFF